MTRPGFGRRLILIGAILLAAACGIASDTASRPSSSDAPAAAAHTLWVMEGAAGKTYLMGSVHALRASDYPLPNALTAAYEDSSALVMELPLNDLDPAAIALTTRRLGVLAPGDSLRNWLGRADHAEAARQCAALGIDLLQFDNLEPWLAALTILNAQMLGAGYSPTAGIETYFAALAKQDGKPVQGLETMEDQLTVFDTLPRREQTLLLFNTLEDASDLEDGLDALVQAWKAGDTDTLHDELNDGFEGLPGMYKGLVVDRNQRWLQKILALDHSDGNQLVIVGALHLVGADSVIALLREQGFRLRQL